MTWSVALLSLLTVWLVFSPYGADAFRFTGRSRCNSALVHHNKTATNGIGRGMEVEGKSVASPGNGENDFWKRRRLRPASSSSSGSATASASTSGTAVDATPSISRFQNIQSRLSARFAKGRRPWLIDYKTGRALPAATESLPDDNGDKKRLKIIIAGAPAAGKGTQCEVIKAKYGVVHLSTGDILRAAVKAGTELGLKAKAFMDAGQLVPDELIIGVVKDRLQQEDCKRNGWLLDGFPRTKSQADALNAAGMIPDCFVLLDVPEDVLVERVTGRRTDPVTGKIYHMRFNPPESEEVARRLVQRSDDTEEKIKIRYREFQSHIDAIRSSYEDRMIKVDGSLPQSNVSELVESSLDDVVGGKSI